MTISHPDTAGVSTDVRHCFRTRLTGVRQELSRIGLHGLVCAGRGELHRYGFVEFLGGFCPWGRDAYVVLGLAGEPVVLSGGAGEKSMAAAITGQLTRLGIGCGPVGAVSHRSGALQAMLPDIAFVDITGQIAAIKSVKTGPEIAQLEAVAELVDEAMDYFVDLIRSDIEHARARVEMLLAHRGCRDWIVRIGPGPRFDVPAPMSALERCNLLCAYVEALGANGYWVEMMRPVAVRRLDLEEQRHLESCLGIADMARALLRPGVISEFVHTAAAEAASRANFRLDGGCGHGVGMDDQDLPRLTAGDNTVMRAGMTVALHPRLVDDGQGRGVVMGDTYLLSVSGARRLSRHPSELIAV